MTVPEKAIGLIERYVREVGRQLPARLRADVEEELRSLLREKLDEHAAARGCMDEDAAVEVLREFGEPGTVAARYLPEAGFLIGPQLFPAYVATAKFVAAAIGVFLLFWYAVGLATLKADLPSFLRASGLFGFIKEYVQLALINLGLLTLVFAIIERVQQRVATLPAASAAAAAAAEIKAKEEPWDPRDLPEPSEPKLISLPDRVWRIYCIVAFFVLLNFYPQYFGVLYIADSGVRSYSIFQMGLRLPVLLLDVWWALALALALNVCLIREGHWTRQWRWVEFGIGIFGGLILYMTLAASTLGDTNADVQAAVDWMNPIRILTGVRTGMPFLGRLIVWILSFCMLGTVIESALRLYRLLRATFTPAAPAMADPS